MIRIFYFLCSINLSSNGNRGAIHCLSTAFGKKLQNELFSLILVTCSSDLATCHHFATFTKYYVKIAISVFVLERKSIILWSSDKMPITSRQQSGYENSVPRLQAERLMPLV